MMIFIDGNYKVKTSLCKQSIIQNEIGQYIIAITNQSKHKFYPIITQQQYNNVQSSQLSFQKQTVSLINYQFNSIPSLVKTHRQSTLLLSQ